MTSEQIKQRIRNGNGDTLNASLSETLSPTRHLLNIEGLEIEYIGRYDDLIHAGVTLNGNPPASRPSMDTLWLVDVACGIQAYKRKIKV